MNGGHAILSAFFGGENIIMSKRGKPETREINPKVNSYYRWYYELGGQRVIHVDTEDKLIRQVKSQWVDKDPVVNILVRTSGRPNYFKECIESIQRQDYPNLNIFVSIDSNDKYTYSYPVYPIEIKRKDPVNIRKEYDYLGKVLPYNLYFNEMHNRVKEGLIMYLDDDDQFCDNKALKKIVKKYKKGSELIFWQVKVGSKVIPPLELWEQKPELFNISGIGYAFDCKYKDIAVWHPFKRSDYRVAVALYEEIKSQSWIKGLFTCTQEGSHSGIRIDKEINKINGEKMEKIIKIKIVNPTYRGRSMKKDR
jgi:glycosyltransferase involved in cell wall biosynthesis